MLGFGLGSRFGRGGARLFEVLESWFSVVSGWLRSPMKNPAQTRFKNQTLQQNYPKSVPYTMMKSHDNFLPIHSKLANTKHEKNNLNFHDALEGIRFCKR